MSNKEKIQYIVGIDEVGRGALAGPLVVCACCLPKDFDFDIFSCDIKDSKKLQPKKREIIFKECLKLKSKKVIKFCLVSSSAEQIDKKGLAFCLQTCIQKVLDNLNVNPQKTLILLDGGLKASALFKNQKTIVKGDSTEKIISLASIIAKVYRDKLMIKKSKIYPQYCFEIHKGYGTQLHIKRIKKHDLSKIHRKSFCSFLN